MDYVLTACSKYNILRQQTLWHGRKNWNIKSFFNEPANSNPSAIFVARTGLLRELVQACPVDVCAEASRLHGNGDMPSTRTIHQPKGGRRECIHKRSFEFKNII